MFTVEWARSRKSRERPVIGPRQTLPTGRKSRYKKEPTDTVFLYVLLFLPTIHHPRITGINNIFDDELRGCAAEAVEFWLVAI